MVGDTWDLQREVMLASYSEAQHFRWRTAAPWLLSS